MRKRLIREKYIIRISLVLGAAMVGAVLFYGIPSMILGSEKVTWNYFWVPLVFGFLFLILPLRARIYEKVGDWSEELENATSIRSGLYIPGYPKSWEYHVKHLPLYCLIAAGSLSLFSFVALAILLA